MIERVRRIIFTAALLGFIAVMPASAASGQDRPHTSWGRYQIVGSGERFSFVVIDTETGRCWELHPGMSQAHRWRDLGTPPVDSKKDDQPKHGEKETKEAVEEAKATQPAERIRQALRQIEAQEQHLREVQQQVSRKKLEMLRALEAEGLLYDKLDVNLPAAKR